MGTSTSSNGPNGGISFDPPWLVSEEEDGNVSIPEPESPELSFLDIPTVLRPNDIAPRARYAPARKALNQYIASGNRNVLKKALGAYSRKGMGGASRLAGRMSLSAQNGANAVAFFNSFTDGKSNENSQWLKDLLNANVSQTDIFDKIAAKISPEVGSIDENSCRDSITQALIDLEESDPNFDITNLSADNIQDFLCFFLSNEIFNRVIIDIGQSFERHFSVQETCDRKKEMREYISFEVKKQVANHWKSDTYITKTAISQVLQQIIRDTFFIFEEEEK